MASFAKHIAFFFLLMLSSSVQIQARESKFFSKIFHLGAKISPLEAPAPTTAAEPTAEPAAAPASSESQDPYYGLYGQGSGMFPHAKETVSTSNTPTTTTTFENDILAEKLADEKYETGYDKNNYNNNGYTTSNYNNGYTSNNYNNNGYTTSNYNNNGYSSNNYNNNGYTTSNYNNNGYSSNYKTNGYNSNYNNNGYETEKQGMSDTRFEGGKYYYDMKNENYYPNGYESSGKETTKNEGYYGNTENSNEFNSTEGFQNKEEYQESQEESVP